MTKFYPALLVLVFSVLTLRGQITVTASGGIPSKDYTSLRTAFNAINTGYHLGDITILVNASVTEAATATLNASGGLSNYTRIRIVPATACVISGNINGPLIDLNGADSVTIDGRINSTDTTRSLTLQNVYATQGGNASTVRFTNGACNNTLQYLNIEGSSQFSETGTISIAEGSTLAASISNTIDRNDIRPANGNRPTKCIYIKERFYTKNSTNRITNNLIHDFWTSLSDKSGGIMINSPYTIYIITGNSVYQTVPVSYTIPYIDTYIEVVGRSGHSISNNFIGGSAPYANGKAIYLGNNSRIVGLHVLNNQFDTTTTVINGNIIRNFNISSSRTVPSFTGISAETGSFIIGLDAGNKVGSLVNDSSIVINYTGSAANAFITGIRYESNDFCNVQNNEIGSFNLSGSLAVNTNITAISGRANKMILRKNTIGSGTGRLQSNTVSGGINGIMIILSFNPNAKYTCIQNTIQHLYNNNTGATATLDGITTISGPANDDGIENKIWNNQISELHATKAGASDGSVKGISLETSANNSTSSSGRHIIRGNQINELTAESNGDTTVVIGISNSCPYYGEMNIDTNTIRHLRSAGRSEDALFHAAVQGISMLAPNNAPVNITGNRIYYLESTATVPTYVVGVNCLHNSDSSILSLTRNHIYYLENAQAGGGVVAGMILNGIRDSGSYSLTNNMIVLKPANAIVYGIYNMFAAGQLKFHFNTITVGGTANGNNVSAAFYRSFFSKSKVISSGNIFYNTRKGGSGKHYAVINDNGAPGWTGSDFNNFYSSNPATVFLWGASDLSYPAYRDSSRQDSCSKSQDVDFTDITYVNVHLQQTANNKSLIAAPVFGITTDFDGDIRHSTPGMGADEIEVPSQISPSVTTTDPTVICKDDSVTLISSVTSGIQWYRNDTAIAGATMGIYHAKQSGSYYVIFREGCTLAISDSVRVTVKPVPPSPPMFTEGPVSFCEGESGLLQTYYLFPALQWFRNDTAIAGANDKNYFAKTTGIYTVTSSIDNCSSAPSEPVVVTALSIPTKPTVSLYNNYYLISSERYNNHWSYNGSYRDADTLQTFYLQGAGKYYVEVRNRNGCKSRSDTFNYTGVTSLSLSNPLLTDVKSSRLEQSILLFPNPARDVLKINAAGFEGSVVLIIYDAFGRQKMTQKITNTGIMQVDIQQLPNAAYLLELKSAKGSVTKWFTKID